MNAADIMTTRFITVSPAATIREVADVLLEYHLYAVLVTDSEEHILGKVSLESLIIKKSDACHLLFQMSDKDPFEVIACMRDEIKKMSALKAEDMMDQDYDTIREDTGVEDIVALMLNKGYYMLPVAREINGKERLVGMVTRHHILKALLQEDLEKPDGTA